MREVEKLAIHSPALRRTLVLQRCPSGLVEVIPISIKSLQIGKKPMRLVSLGLHCRDTLKDFRQNNVELKIGVLGELAVRHAPENANPKASAAAASNLRMESCLQLGLGARLLTAAEHALTLIKSRSVTSVAIPVLYRR